MEWDDYFHDEDENFHSGVNDYYDICPHCGCQSYIETTYTEHCESCGHTQSYF